MKKSITIIGCIFSSFVHGMLEKQLISSSMVFNGTTIKVKTGSIFDANNKVDLIVINKHHHQKLINFVANYYRNQPPSPARLTTTTDNNTVPPAILYSVAKKKSLIPQKFYYTMAVPECTAPGSKEISEEETINITKYFSHTLKKGLTKIGLKKREKTIAFTPLSPYSGFYKEDLELGTTTGIFKFLIKHPYAYEYMELIVEDPHDIGIYTDLFANIYQELADDTP